MTSARRGASYLLASALAACGPGVMSSPERVGALVPSVRDAACELLPSTIRIVPSESLDGHVLGVSPGSLWTRSTDERDGGGQCEVRRHDSRRPRTVLQSIVLPCSCRSAHAVDESSDAILWCGDEVLRVGSAGITWRVALDQGDAPIVEPSSAGTYVVIGGPRGVRRIAASGAVVWTRGQDCELVGVFGDEVMCSRGDFHHSGFAVDASNGHTRRELGSLWNVGDRFYEWNTGRRDAMREIVVSTGGGPARWSSLDRGQLLHAWRAGVLYEHHEDRVHVRDASTGRVVRTLCVPEDAIGLVLDGRELIFMDHRAIHVLGDDVWLVLVEALSPSWDSIDGSRGIQIVPGGLVVPRRSGASGSVWWTGDAVGSRVSAAD